MLSIDSALWSVRSYNDAYAQITQRASRVTRTVSRCELPSADELAAMHEKTFNRTLREAFHNAATR